MPPNEDQLPKPAPVKLWQQGQDKWHVDAPVAVAGDRVIVASAYLDDEKVGERAIAVPGATFLDTNIDGNRNIGHTWGTTLSDSDRWALIEYLKSL